MATSMRINVRAASSSRGSGEAVEGAGCRERPVEMLQLRGLVGGHGQRHQMLTFASGCREWRRQRRGMGMGLGGGLPAGMIGRRLKTAAAGGREWTHMSASSSSSSPSSPSSSASFPPALFPPLSIESFLPPLRIQSYDSIPFERAGSCFVFVPQRSKPQEGSIRASVSKREPPFNGIIHFLGGAFIGAAPDLFYSYFIEMLLERNFLVISTPYNVTFDHLACAASLRFKFFDCLSLLQSDGIPSAGINGSDLSRLPIYGVGHSNGALMTALISSQSENSKGSNKSSSQETPEGPSPLFAGNVIISYNNKPASDAVPAFDQLGLVLRSFASSPASSAAQQLAETLSQQLQSLAPPSLLPPLPSTLTPLVDPSERFAQQLGPVFGEVQSGVTEFSPPPEENRRLIGTSYSSPRTLLIQFSSDSIDETDLLQALLSPRLSSLKAQLNTVTLNGTHATPLAPDVAWQVSNSFSPSDAILQSLKSASLADIRQLATVVADWLEQR